MVLFLTCTVLASKRTNFRYWDDRRYMFCYIHRVTQHIWFLPKICISAVKRMKKIISRNTIRLIAVTSRFRLPPEPHTTRQALRQANLCFGFYRPYNPCLGKIFATTVMFWLMWIYCRWTNAKKWWYSSLTSVTIMVTDTYSDYCRAVLCRTHARWTVDGIIGVGRPGHWGR